MVYILITRIKCEKMNKRDFILANKFHRTLYLHNNFVDDEIYTMNKLLLKLLYQYIHKIQCVELNVTFSLHARCDSAL